MSDWQEQAREAGWLPPNEVRLKVWSAHNLNHGCCRWCGARRVADPADISRLRPHRPGCRFFAGPVKHEVASGHQGTFDWWIRCTCGKNYPEHDEDGIAQTECPDAALTHLEPQAEDLLAV